MHGLHPHWPSQGNRGRGPADHFSCDPRYTHLLLRKPVARGNALRRCVALHFLGSWVGLEMQEGFQALASTLNVPLTKS